MGCIQTKKSQVIHDVGKEVGTSHDKGDLKQDENVLFVVKEEQSYLEQSYAPSKRQSVARESFKID